MTSITLYIRDTNEGEEEVRSELMKINVGPEASLKWLTGKKKAWRIRITGQNRKALYAAKKKVEARAIDLGRNTSLG